MPTPNIEMIVADRNTKRSDLVLRKSGAEPAYVYVRTRRLAMNDIRHLWTNIHCNQRTTLGYGTTVQREINSHLENSLVRADIVWS